MDEGGIATCDREVELLERFVQVTRFAVQQRELHRWPVRVCSNRILQDAGTMPRVVDATEVVDQGLRRSSEAPTLSCRIWGWGSPPSS